MTNCEMQEWLVSNHREVLYYLKQEFDGDIKDYHDPEVVMNMENRFYCKVGIEYVDGIYKMAELVVTKRPEGVAIERLKIHEYNLPMGF